MDTNTITIPVQEYKELIQIKDRVEILKRFYTNGTYICENEIFDILNFDPNIMRTKNSN